VNKINYEGITTGRLHGTEHPKVFSVSSALYPSMNSSINETSLDIFFVGCTNECKGCHNKELQTFIPSNKTWNQITTTIVLATKATVVTLLGGEPLQQDLQLIKKLLEFIHRIGIKTCIYTGLDFEAVPKDILSELDYLKTGFYDEDNLTPIGSFLASENQKMFQKVGDNWEVQWEYDEGEEIRSL